jgi:hypothetical protein
MDSAEFADREQLDQATSLLMASLRESRALNIEIREALQRREQADAIEPQEGADQSSTGIFRLLSDIIDGVSHP